MKPCAHCKQLKPLEEFDKNRHRKDGRQHTCKVCRSDREKQPEFREKRKIYQKKYYKQNIERFRQLRQEYNLKHQEWKKAYDKKWQAENKDKRRIIRQRHYYKKHYGLTLEQKEAMYIAQKGICFLCLNLLPQSWLDANIDHDHTTNRVRKLLCDSCNRNMCAVDNENWLERAILYRNQFKKDE